jgi:hypothetical protein
LRLVLIVVVTVLFMNLIGPVSTWFGQSLAGTIHLSVPSASPSP